MFVPPNWVGLGAFALLGLVNPGFWVIGAGLELAYLIGLGTSRRFQRVVDGRALLAEQQRWQQRLMRTVAELDPEGRERHTALLRRCQSIIEQQEHVGTGDGRSATLPELDVQRQGLGRLMWIYLRLLRTRQAIMRVLRESIDLERGQGEALDRRVARLQQEISRAARNDDLRRSIEGQIEILQQRLQKRQETREKLAFIDAELDRIEQQVELIREQAVIASEPSSVSARIDQIAATLGDTQQWMRDQQQIVGQLDEILAEPPPLAAPQRVSQ
jgi:hypothetical protein